jgi:hypothetical protein
VFRLRVEIETAIVGSLEHCFATTRALPGVLFSGHFYGSSKKQGLSVRFALISCHATKQCASACYAHDVLDAAPGAVVRGALNHFTASVYERHPDFREEIGRRLAPHTRQALTAALTEAEQLGASWTREARIRFAHVGEAAAYPQFSNALARQVLDMSGGRVKCVVYTRHKKAAELDPELFVVNFTLDDSSERRRNWIPSTARTVFAAFGGRVSRAAEVNFLEHHRWSHAKPKGEGNVCPATRPETIDRTCDAVRCDLCFQQPHENAAAERRGNACERLR